MGRHLTFTVTTRNAAGAHVDADAAPAYRVYENQSAETLMTGNMAAFDDPNTTGFYAATISLSGANGFEAFRIYTIYVTAAIAGVTANKSFNFVCLRSETVQELATGPVSNTEVLGVVNQRLNRQETSVDRELRAALKRITGALDCLQEVEEVTLPVGQQHINLPADFKRLTAVEVAGRELAPMERAEALEYAFDGAQGMPGLYSIWKDRMDFDAAPRADTPVRLSFITYHPGDVAAILLGDEFREAVYALTASNVAANLGGLDGLADFWLGRYHQEMSVLARNERVPVASVRYRDL